MTNIATIPRFPSERSFIYTMSCRSLLGHMILEEFQIFASGARTSDVNHNVGQH